MLANCSSHEDTNAKSLTSKRNNIMSNNKRLSSTNQVGETEQTFAVLTNPSKQATASISLTQGYFRTSTHHHPSPTCV